MSKTLLSCLGLGAAAAITLTGGSVAGGFAAGLGGNLATDFFKVLHRRVAERFLDGWSGIDENHHIDRALRLAQIDALRVILKDFTAIYKADPDLKRRREANRFGLLVAAFLDRETKTAQSFGFLDESRVSAQEFKIRDQVLRTLPEAFDQSLAVRRANNERAAIVESLKLVQNFVEAAVIEEIRIQVLTPQEDFPPQFLHCFRGTRHSDSWFDLFVRDAAGKLKEQAEFDRIWSAEQIALIAAIVRAHETVLDKIDQRTATTEIKINGLSDEIARRFLEILSARDISISQKLSEVSMGTNSLPLRPARIFGRNNSIDCLVHTVLGETGSGHVIVSGGPGVGKSTLIKEASCHEEVVLKFGGHRYFVGLETASDIERFEFIIAQSLGLKGGISFDLIVEFLRRQSSSLLILDNLETAWEAFPVEVEERLAKLASRCPSVRVLASIRGGMIPASVGWSLHHALGPLDRIYSCALFRDIAPQISETDPCLSGLINELGGVPLAIELVAFEAQPFKSLAPLVAHWKEIGTSLAKKRGAEEGRTTSLDFSLRVSISSPRRHKESAALLRAIATLPGGLDFDVGATALAPDFYEAVSDLLRSGLVYQENNRVDALLPIKSYISAQLMMSEAMKGRLASAYIGLIDALFCKPQQRSTETILLVIEAEFQNITAVSKLIPTRFAPSRLLATIASSISEFGKRIEMFKEATALAPPVQFVRTLERILAYVSSRAHVEQDWRSKIVADQCRVICESIILSLLSKSWHRCIEELKSISAAADPVARALIETAITKLQNTLDSELLRNPNLKEFMIDNCSLIQTIKDTKGLLESIGSVSEEDLAAFMNVPNSFNQMEIDFDLLRQFDGDP